MNREPGKGMVSEEPEGVWLEALAYVRTWDIKEEGRRLRRREDEGTNLTIRWTFLLCQ